MAFPIQIKNPYCFHSKGESTFSRYHLASPISHDTSLIRLPVTAWHSNARHSAAAYFLSKQLPCDSVQRETPGCIHIRFLHAPLIDRPLSVWVFRILLVPFQAFSIYPCLIEILSYLWIIVNPKIGDGGFSEVPRPQF